MQLQDVIVTKTFPAYFARIRFLAGMRPGMNLQLFAARESLLANSANVRLLARVCPHVNHQLPRLNESLGAHRTFVRSFASVDPHMPVQFAGMFKSSGAHFTFVRSLFGVDSSVDTEVFFYAEALITKLAPRNKTTNVRKVLQRFEINFHIVYALFRIFFPLKNSRHAIVNVLQFF